MEASTTVLDGRGCSTFNVELLASLDLGMGSSCCLASLAKYVKRSAELESLDTATKGFVPIMLEDSS